MQCKQILINYAIVNTTSSDSLTQCKQIMINYAIVNILKLQNLSKPGIEICR